MLDIREIAGDMYNEELARQLAEFLQKVLERTSGMIALIDVYCVFNRARGVGEMIVFDTIAPSCPDQLLSPNKALISPEDLQNACAAFERLRLPLRLRKFDSGLLVVQSNILFLT